MTGTDEENMEVHIEKEEDDEEIQGRNEVSVALNDYNSERNNNVQVTVKDKNLGAHDLAKLAIETIKAVKIQSEQKNKDKKVPGTA